MSGLSESAKLVKDALESRGLETPMVPSEFSREEKKEKIQYHMREILSLLDLDLTDDSLEETPHRIAKMYVDEIFSGLDYQNFPKITVIENKMNVSEMVRVKDITLTSTCEHHLVTIDGKAAVAYIRAERLLVCQKLTASYAFSLNARRYKSV
ncbi:GTP cyclohydrolase I type 1 [Vibrio ponticus]|nr:GTP cyclohydrolase I type 1 [Vibrio ponticus]